jgi:hypothetical protein
LCAPVSQVEDDEQPRHVHHLAKSAAAVPRFAGISGTTAGMRIGI